jgi:hypothetical protein
VYLPVSRGQLGDNFPTTVRRGGQARRSGAASAGLGGAGSELVIRRVRHFDERQAVCRRHHDLVRAPVSLE